MYFLHSCSALECLFASILFTFVQSSPPSLYFTLFTLLLSSPLYLFSRFLYLSFITSVPLSSLFCLACHSQPFPFPTPLLSYLTTSLLTDPPLLSLTTPIPFPPLSYPPSLPSVLPSHSFPSLTIPLPFPPLHRPSVSQPLLLTPGTVLAETQSPMD